jgi:hypothetical protein
MVFAAVASANAERDSLFRPTNHSPGQRSHRGSPLEASPWPAWPRTRAANGRSRRWPLMRYDQMMRGVHGETRRMRRVSHKIQHEKESHRLQRQCATLGSPLSQGAFDFRAAAVANVGHLDQAIAEFDCLARLRSRGSVFLGRHSATTARTDHDWLFLARHHGREVTMMCRCRKEIKSRAYILKMSFACSTIGLWATSDGPAGAIHRRGRPQS